MAKISEARELLEWIADFESDKFTPAYYDTQWPVAMYGLACSASIVAAAYLDLVEKLKPIMGDDPHGMDGLHFVGDEKDPDECPGCLVRKAVGVPTVADVDDLMDVDE